MERLALDRGYYLGYILSFIDSSARPIESQIYHIKG